MPVVNVQIDDSFWNQLKEKLGGKKDADVIQDAINLLNWAADKKLEGKQIASTEGQDFQTITMPALDNIKKK